jgi:lipopolysaccharide export system permease protein
MEELSAYQQTMTPAWSSSGRRSWPWILYRYLWQECWTIFFVGLLAITIIVFMGRITRVMQMIITKGVALPDIFRFCLLLMPYLLLFTLPMAGMIAVLVTFLRLSNDNEIMALKTSGISAVQLLPPMVAFSFVITGVALFFSLYATPWGNQEMRQLLMDITKRRADLGIREQVFNNDFYKMTFFVNNVPTSGGLMEGVFLLDDREPQEPNVITADKAKMLFDPKSERLVLQLFQGRVLRFNEDAATFHSIEFNTYQVPLELFQFGQQSKSEDEMFYSELREALARVQPGSVEQNKLLIEINRRFSLPLGVTIMVLTVMPLGISTQIRGRAVGLIMGLIIFLLYYLLLTAAWRLGTYAMIPPAFAPWIPNLVFLGLAIFLWRRALRDLPIAVFEGPLPGWEKLRTLFR